MMPDLSRNLALIFSVPLFCGGCVVIPIGDLLTGPALEEQVLQQGAGFWETEKIAIVDISGVVTGEESTNLLMPHPNTVSEVTAQLDRAARDPEVKAVVLRISSPGGEVTACDTLHHEVLRLREERDLPVVACILDQGASGAYYIACGASTIVAHPTSIVGSVGVILNSFDLSGLLAKLGVTVDPVKSGDKKDMNSMFRQRTPEEREILQSLVDSMHRRFIDVVTEGREKLNREQVVEFADGRVVTGVEAAAAGFVDTVGYLRDAIDKAGELAGVDSPTIVRYTRRARSGANIYTQSTAAPTPSAAPAELTLRWDPRMFPRARLYYLWLP
ncbi:MAG: signal peptide peptidase SppA [Planctomycetota bacterium]|nr:signal peptide peptidase SppA [Planctomycetota bacterium]